MPRLSNTGPLPRSRHTGWTPMCSPSRAQEWDAEHDTCPFCLTPDIYVYDMKRVEGVKVCPECFEQFGGGGQ